MGIATAGTAEVHEPDAVHYATINYMAIWPILRHLQLGPADVFVDLGCGKGRVVCCASCFSVKAALGIEADARLSPIEAANAARVRGRRATVRIVNATVQDFEYTTETAFYLFNPFGATTLRKVLAKVELSLRTHPRLIRIAYVFPAHAALLAECGWLECECLWQVRHQAGLQHQVSFWRSRP